MQDQIETPRTVASRLRAFDSRADRPGDAAGTREGARLAVRVDRRVPRRTRGRCAKPRAGADDAGDRRARRRGGSAARPPAGASRRRGDPGRGRLRRQLRRRHHRVRPARARARRGAAGRARFVAEQSLCSRHARHFLDARRGMAGAPGLRFRSQPAAGPAPRPRRADHPPAARRRSRAPVRGALAAGERRGAAGGVCSGEPGGAGAGGRRAGSLRPERTVARGGRQHGSRGDRRDAPTSRPPPLRRLRRVPPPRHRSQRAPRRLRAPRIPTGSSTGTRRPDKPGAARTSRSSGWVIRR